MIAARNSHIRGRVCKLTQRGLLGREVRNDAERGLHEHLDCGWSGSPLGGYDPRGRLRLVYGGSMRVKCGLVNARRCRIGGQRLAALDPPSPTGD